MWLGRVGRRVRRVGVRGRGHREYSLGKEGYGRDANLAWGRGYVALAVSTEKGTYTREVETGLGQDREANMVAFAVAGLELVRDVIKGDAKL